MLRNESQDTAKAQANSQSKSSAKRKTAIKLSTSSLGAGTSMLGYSLSRLC